MEFAELIRTNLALSHYRNWSKNFENGTEKIISISFHVSSYRILAPDKINIIFYIFLKGKA